MFHHWEHPLLFVRFQNGCNKVAIELRVVQFWSEVTLVISDHIALHSVQLPLLIDVGSTITNNYRSFDIVNGRASIKLNRIGPEASSLYFCGVSLFS